MKYPVKFDLEFLRHYYPGKLIAIEGIDGSGKTTQAKKLVDALAKKGNEAIYTKEPTDGEIGKFIRQILAGEKKFEPFAFQYLFVADRVVHQEEIIEHLKQGKIVISDRCFWSSVAYGGVDRGIDFSKDSQNGDLLLSAFGILSPYHQFLVPDITVYLDVSADIAIERLNATRHNADIYDKREKLEKIAAGYDWLIHKFPEQFTVIDASRVLEEVSEDLLAAVRKKLE